jgi:hypothetical protein
MVRLASSVGRAYFAPTLPPAGTCSRARILVLAASTLMGPAAPACRVDDRGLPAVHESPGPSISSKDAFADEDAVSRGDGGWPVDATEAGETDAEPDAQQADGELERDADGETGAADAEGMSSHDGGDGANGVAAELGAGLVLWLPFEEPTGAGVARDDSGQRNQVGLHGLDPALAWVPGRIGRALDLAAAGVGTGYLRAESSPSINRVGNELSIAVWLWHTGEQPGVIVSRRASAAAGTLYRLSVEATAQLRLLLNDRRGVRLDLRSADPVRAGRWVHVAATSDREAARLYIDGLPVATARYGVPFAPDVSPVLIGAGDTADGPAGFLRGRLDELAVYHRALSSAEVTLLAGGARPPGVGEETYLNPPQPGAGTSATTPPTPRTPAAAAPRN